MYQVIIVIHVLLGLGVIGLILMQQGKGADAGAAFGTGSSGSVFGAQGAASFLSRATAILATLFFTTSLGLAVLNSKKDPGNDLISTTEIQQKSAAQVVIEPKVIEDIPAQSDIKDEQIQVAPPTPAAITTAPTDAPVENLNSKPPETVLEEDASPKISEKPVVEIAPKAVEKTKAVKKSKHDDSKANKKIEKKTETQDKHH
jgi:preprotein translocase subunit SecG